MPTVDTILPLANLTYETLLQGYTDNRHRFAKDKDMKLAEAPESNKKTFLAP